MIDLRQFIAAECLIARCARSVVHIHRTVWYGSTSRVIKRWWWWWWNSSRLQYCCCCCCCCMQRSVDSMRFTDRQMHRKSPTTAIIGLRLTTGLTTARLSASATTVWLSSGQRKCRVNYVSIYLSIHESFVRRRNSGGGEGGGWAPTCRS